MAEDPSTGMDPEQDPGDPKDPAEDLDTEDPKDPEQDPEDKPKADPEKAKLITARDRAKEKARQLQERVSELEEKLNPGKKDPVAVANRRLVTAEARVALTTKGITDPAEQKEVMDFLALDSVSVSDDGEVDSDAITERLDTLARIFGKGKQNGRRTPNLDTRDLGGERGKPVDPAKARRLSMLRS